MRQKGAVGTCCQPPGSDLQRCARRFGAAGNGAFVIGRSFEPLPVKTCARRVVIPPAKIGVQVDA